MSSIKPHAMLVLLAAVAAVDTEVTYLFHQWKVSTAPPRLSTWSPQVILQPQISARNKQTTVKTAPPTPTPETLNDEEETPLPPTEKPKGDEVGADEDRTENVPETIKTTSKKPTNSTTGTTKLIDLITFEPKENGGFPVAKPGKHKHGLRHVKAHDGFHNLKREPQWAHLNDKLKTRAKPAKIN